MQPYDPKLYEQDPAKKAPGLSTERAVKRGEQISEGDTGRRRFSLDPDKEEDPEKEVSGDFKEELPSALSLAGAIRKAAKTKQQQPGQGDTQNPREAPLFNPLNPQSYTETIAQAQGMSANKKAEMIDLAKEMIRSLETIHKEGITETRITLSHPPIFDGATLSIRAFDTAKGEFNITFSDLNNQAKALLDQAHLRDNLVQALNEKGFTIHIFIASTETEKALYAEEGEPPKKEQEKEKKEEDEA